MSTEIIKSNTPVQFNFFDNEQFQTMQRICTMFASSELVPDMYKISEKNPKEKAIANCMIAVETAQRIGASALMVMQNMIVIYGRPSWSSKFLIATVNTCGRFDQLRYRFKDLGKVGKIKIIEYVWENNKKVPREKEFDGSAIDNIECVAYSYEIGREKEELECSPVSVEMAIKEGWYTKAGSKWPNMTKKMLIYRAASFWTNEYAPELSMGMRTEEEERDITDIPYEDISEKVKTDIKTNANKTTVSFDENKNGNSNGNGTAAKEEKDAAKPEQTAQPVETSTEKNPI